MNKYILNAINNINNISYKLQEQGSKRFKSLNVLNDYKIILNDERVKNKDIINTIISELKEYKNAEVVDYYEQETHEAIMEAYRKEFYL